MKMNMLSKQFGLNNTKYANPHGLNNKHNLSSAYDVALLSQIGLKDPIFEKIVNTKVYFTQIIGPDV